jgi:uncharacterized protein (TIGR03437 family)
MYGIVTQPLRTHVSWARIVVAECSIQEELTHEDASYFISPGQINVLAPDIASGPIAVTVTTAAGASAPFSATANVYAPALFTWPENQPVVTRQDYSFVAKPGTFSAATTVAAKPGEVLILWATGLGPTPFGRPSAGCGRLRECCSAFGVSK